MNGDGDKPAVQVCKDPRPSSAESRLIFAMEAVDSALTCMDLRKLQWTPIASDAWERAAAGLSQVRHDLLHALEAWRANRAPAASSDGPHSGMARRPPGVE